MRIPHFCLLFALSLALYGCGGGSSPVAGNRFAGNWAGTFANDKTPAPQSGTMNISVTTNGTVTGQIVFPDQPAPAPLSGGITPEGHTTLDVSMPIVNGQTNVQYLMTGDMTQTGSTISGGLRTTALGSYQYLTTPNLTRY